VPRPPAAARRPRVLVAGGGVAGLEGLLALRAQLGGSAELVLLDPATEFAYRPLAVVEPFGRGSPRRFDLAAIAADHGATHRRAALAGVDVHDRRAVLPGGAEIAYDALLVAVGARPREALPGALTFRGPGDAAGFATLLDELAGDRALRLAFAVPVGVAWSLPLYELALMTAERLGRPPQAQRLALVTPEPAPLAAFGAEVAERMAQSLAARGIAVHAGAAPAAIDEDGVRLEGGDHVEADRVVALPRLEGPWIPGLPHDDEGFVPVDAHGAVTGAPGVWAAGDGTTFPLKQGGIAAQQADAAATAIAAELGAAVTPEPFRPTLRAQLLDGRAPRYLRAETSEDGDAAGEVSTSALWWPPSKVAARYLAPYLAEPHPAAGTPEELADRPRARAAAATAPAADREDMTALLLALADQNARWGDVGTSLRCLDAVERLDGALPAGYAGRRREWEARRTRGARR
jgi:sulfide:quinone oxidoreductase